MTPEVAASAVTRGARGPFTPPTGRSSQLPASGRRRQSSQAHQDLNASVNDEANSVDEDSFFELLTRFQSKRMDDQRCTLAGEEGEEGVPPAPALHPLLENDDGAPIFNGAPDAPVAAAVGGGPQQQPEELLELIVGMQSRRMDEQRATLPAVNDERRALPGLTNNAVLHRFSQGGGQDSAQAAAAASTHFPDDDFFDMLMRCQSSRLEDQRSTLPIEGLAAVLPPAAPTVPCDDFFTLIMRFQAAGRLDDQRSALPTCNNNNNTSRNANSTAAANNGLLAGPGLNPPLLRGVSDGAPPNGSLAPPTGQEENGDALTGEPSRHLMLPRGSNASSTSGVVVPSGGLTKAILDRIRNGGKGQGDTVPPAASEEGVVPSAGGEEKGDASAPAEGGANNATGGKREKLLNRFVKHRK